MRENPRDANFVTRPALGMGQPQAKWAPMSVQKRSVSAQEQDMRQEAFEFLLPLVTMLASIACCKETIGPTSTVTVEYC